jgi:hypothetical protein
MRQPANSGHTTETQIKAAFASKHCCVNNRSGAHRFGSGFATGKARGTQASRELLNTPTAQIPAYTNLQTLVAPQLPPQQNQPHTPIDPT